MNIWHGLVVAIGLFFMLDYCNGQQQGTTPFQVSIRMYDKDAGKSYVICNGAIINESYVVTTAHCMFNHVIGTNVHRPIAPNMIFIAGGNFTNSPDNIRDVSNIYIHEQYNPNVWENDIALLKLNRQFSLYNSTTITWIKLDEMQNRPTDCVASFTNISSRGYPFIYPQLARVMDSSFCSNQTNITRRDQICSHYIFADNRMCETPASQLELSADRGTPLMCNSYLVGLLSTILPPNNTLANETISCQRTQRTSAFYTKILPHAQWLGQRMNQYGPAAPAYYNPIPISPQQPNYPSGSINPQQNPNQAYPTVAPQFPPPTTPPSNKRSGCQGHYSSMALVLVTFAATFSTIVVKSVF